VDRGTGRGQGRDLSSRAETPRNRPRQAEQLRPMLDTTPVTTEITKLIVAGTPESEIIMRMMRRFPDLTIPELSQVLQVATAAAEKQATRWHLSAIRRVIARTLGS
jgi:hypothetical protein